MQKAKRSGMTRGICRVFGVVWLALLMLAVAGFAQDVDWTVGDVFVGTGGGHYQVWHSANPSAKTPVYTMLPQINDGTTGLTAGCAFDSAYRPFTTNFSNNDVVRFTIDATHGTVTGPNSNFPIQSTHFTGAHAVAFDGSGNLYVGYANGGLEIYKHDGTLLIFFPPGTMPVEAGGGVNWLDVAADEHTVFYTSNGRKIFTFNTSTLVSQVYANLALVSNAGAGPLGAIRILPPGNGTGGVLVADTSNVKLVMPNSVVTNVFKFSGESNLKALSLDPLFASVFWAGDATSGDLIRFDMSKTQKTVTFPTGAGTALGGICVDGSFSPAQFALTPQAPPTSLNSNCTTPALANGLTCNLTPTSNTVTFKSPYAPNNTFTVTLAGLSQNVALTLRDSQVDSSVAQSDPTVFSFIPNSTGLTSTVQGSIPCVQSPLHSGPCEVFELEANPNSGYSTVDLLVCPPGGACSFINQDSSLPNVHLLKNLDEDITTGLDGSSGGTLRNCVFTLNQQTFNTAICNPATDSTVIGFESPVGSQTFSKNLNSTISFKFQIGIGQQFSNGTFGTCNANTSPPLCPSTGLCVTPLLLVAQTDTGGAPAALPSCSPTVSTQCIDVAGGSSQAFLPPVFVLSGNTWQLQIKSSTMNAGSYLATVVDLNSVIPTFSVAFTLQ